MIKKEIKIGGMTCVACSSGLERQLKKNPKVKKVQVNFPTETMEIEYEDNLNFQEIEQVIKSLGFYIKKEDNTQKNEHAKLKLILSVIFTVPLLYIAMAHMLPYISLPYPNIIDPHTNPVNFAIIQFILCLPVILSGYQFYTVGYRLLWKRSPNMDSLVAIGTTASFLYSVFSVYKIITGDLSFVHSLYFESTATIITLVELGKYLENKSKSKTKYAIEKLIGLAPKTGIVIREGKEVEIKIEDIKVGDFVVVKNGEKIPVDGKIIEGNASIDESMITGESIPIDKTIDDVVIGATINKNGYIKIEATKIGKDTALSQIIQLVEKAQNSKAPAQKLADTVSGYFTVIVLILAILSSVVWFAFGEPITFALTIFVSVLVIACPCALGLATPIAIMVASGKGAEIGVLYKDAESIESLSKINAVVFDKTGTLTIGQPKVTDVIVIGVEEKEFLTYVSSIESKSEHPLSLAMIEYARKRNIRQKEVIEFKNIVGKGISAVVENDNISIGNVKLMEDLKIDIKNEQEKINELTSQGKTVMLVTRNTKLIGIIAVADVIRENSIALIEQLHQLKINTYMITGDSENTARAIANQLKIKNVIANTLPEDKSRKVEQLKEQGLKVAMVGDGINDSPALTQADVGIAIGNGTDVAIESAGIILVKNDILDVLKAIQLSKKTMRIIKQNLFWAFGYNTIGIPVAMGLLYIFGGPLLNPMIAALAMAFSSVSVVTNALRINYFK